MPFDKILAQQHEAQARHNYALFNQLRTNENYSDWLVTLLFYTVLHLAQAHLVEVSTSGFDIPKGHPQRACYIARKLSEIYANYRFLETRSSWRGIIPKDQNQPFQKSKVTTTKRSHKLPTLWRKKAFRFFLDACLAPVIP